LDATETIRSQVNIVNLISHYVKLEKRGKNYLGLCPFHGDKSPSMNVNAEKGFYHCFACKAGGDSIKFVEEIEHISFREALVKIAELEDIQVDLPRSAPVRQVSQSEVELLEMHKFASELYHHTLTQLTAGENALAYLKERGLKDETIETFQIGFAPPEREFLVKAFKAKGYTHERMLESDLIAENARGEAYDRFAGRITFPIRNEKGQVAAFSARKIYTEEEAKADPRLKQNKYINSSDTPIFEKKNFLFNYDLARREIRKSKEVFLLEGQMDVIAAFQAGVENSVASLGTALTDIQLKKLLNDSEKLVTVFDGDEAGIKATSRVLEMFEKSNSNADIAIVTLPDGLDPDDYVRKFGAEALRNLLQTAQSSVYSFKKQTLKKNYNLQNEQDVIAYVEVLIKELAKNDIGLATDKHLNDLHEEFPSFSKSALFTQFEKERTQNRPLEVTQDVPNDYDYPAFPDYEPPVFNGYAPVEERPPIVVIKEYSSIEKAEQQLLYRLFYERAVQRKLMEDTNFAFAHETYQKLYVLLQGFLRTHPQFEESGFLAFIEEDQLKSKATEIFSLNVPQETDEGEVDDLLKTLDKSSIQEQILRKKEELLPAQHSGNKDYAKKLVNEIIDLQRLLKRI